jgi:hypothetical protein
MMANSACVRHVTKPPREHETAARCSPGRVDGVAASRRREASIFTMLKFGKLQKSTLSQRRLQSYLELFRQLAGHLLERSVREHELHHALVVVGLASRRRLRPVELL